MNVGQAVFKAIADFSSIGKEGKAAVSDLEASADDAGKAGEKTGNKFTAGLKGALKVAGAVGGIAAAFFTGSALSAGMDRLTTIQDSTTALTQSFQSAGKAADFMGEILKVVSGTPFNLDQFAQAGSMMVGFGVDSQKIPGYLTAIGEASARMGDGAGEAAAGLSEAFGEVTTSGSISSDLLDRLAGTGVNALKILANHFGVTTDEAQKMVSEGLVPASEGLDILTDGIMNGSDGVAGATLAMKGTMAGLRETLSGARGGFKASVARFGANVISPFTTLITKGFQNSGLVLDAAGKMINKGLQFIVDSPGGKALLEWMTTFPDRLKTFGDSFSGVGARLKPLALEITGGLMAMALGFTGFRDGVTSSGLAGLLEAIGVSAGKVWDLLSKVGKAVMKPDVGPLDQLAGIFTKLADVGVILLPALTDIGTSLGAAAASLGVSAWQLLVIALNLTADVLLILVPYIQKLADFMKAHPQLVTAVVGAYTAYRFAVILATAATLAQAAAMKVLTGAGALSTIAQGALYFIGLARAQGIATAATWLMTAATRGLGLAFLANPVFWIVLAIIALIAAIVLLVMNWDAVVAWVTQVWGGFVNWAKEVTDGFMTWWNQVWGGFANWVTEIWDGMVNWIVEVWDGFISWIMSVVDGFVSWWSSVWDPIAAAISDIWNGIVQFFTDTWNSIVSGVTGFVNFFIAIWNSVMTFLAPLFAVFDSMFRAFGAIFEFIGALIGFVIRGIIMYFQFWQTMIATSMAAIWAVITSVWNTIVSVIQSVMNTIGQTVSSIWNAMVGWVSSALNAIWSAVSSVWNMVMGVIGSVLAQVWAVVSSIWQQMVDFVSAGMNAVWAVVSSVWNMVVGYISAILGQIWAVVSSVWNMVAGFIGGILGQIWGSISSAWNQMLSYIGIVMGMIWSAIVNKWNEITGWMSGIGGMISNAVGNLGNLLWNAGQSIIQGLLNGLKSMWDGVAGFFQNLTASIPSWKGPEKTDKKLLTKAGHLVMGGFLGALESMYGTVKKSLNNFTDSLSTGADVVITPTFPGGGFDPGAMLADANYGRTTDVLATTNATAHLNTTPTSIHYDVKELNVNNPKPERASDSLPRAVRKLGYVGVGSNA